MLDSSSVYFKFPKKKREYNEFRVLGLNLSLALCDFGLTMSSQCWGGVAILRKPLCTSELKIPLSPLFYSIPLYSAHRPAAAASDLHLSMAALSRLPGQWDRGTSLTHLKRQLLHLYNGNDTENIARLGTRANGFWRVGVVEHGGLEGPQLSTEPYRMSRIWTGKQDREGQTRLREQHSIRKVQRKGKNTDPRGWRVGCG